MYSDINRNFLTECINKYIKSDKILQTIYWRHNRISYKQQSGLPYWLLCALLRQ